MRRPLAFASVALVASALALAASATFASVASAQQPPAAPVSAPPAQVTAVTTQVQAFYDQSSSFDADFTQEYWVKQYNVKKQSHGHVTFKKPGKMYWRYDEPVGNRVVSDGQKLKVYEANNKQMYEQDVNASQYPAALSFL